MFRLFFFGGGGGGAGAESPKKWRTILVLAELFRPLAIAAASARADAAVNNDGV